MARIKPNHMITTKEAAEKAIEQIDQIDRQLAAWHLEEANAIAKLREVHQNRQRDGGRIEMEAKKMILVKEVEHWAIENSASWDKKSMTTPFGSIGFRLDNPTVSLIKRTAKTIKDAIALLQQKLPAYVREQPEIDKERILADDRDKTLDIATLSSCGLEVRQEDRFWLETASSAELEKASARLKAA